jgi:hypothetical protein
MQGGTRAIVMQNQHRIGAICGLIGCILGAVITGTVVRTFAHPSAPDAMPTSANPNVAQSEQLTMSGRMVFSVVQADEISDAVETMRKLPEEQKSIRADLEEQKYRLFWLTAWDWNTQGESGDTVAITSDSFRRVLTLGHRERRIAIPEPRSGHIELEGVLAEGSGISISLLSGSHPIALPQMPIGKKVKVEVLVADQLSSRNAPNEVKSEWQSEAER